MKKTPLKRIGKIGKINIETNHKLKEIYANKPKICEAKLKGCKKHLFLGFAHRKRRWEYIKEPQKLADLNETLLLCVACHTTIDNNKKLLEKVFKRLRG